MGRVLPISGLLLNHSECDPARSRSLREQERQVWDGCGLGTRLCLSPAMTLQGQVRYGHQGALLLPVTVTCWTFSPGSRSSGQEIPSM